MRPGTEIFSDADGRSTERERAESTLFVRLFQMVGPATGKARPPTVDSFTDAVPADDLSEKSGGNVDQADWRHEPVDSGMTAQFHEWPCRPT